MTTWQMLPEKVEQMANGKRIKYPKRLKIGAKSYKIHWSADEWVNRPAEDRQESCWGVTNHILLGIWINPELHPTNKRETLLHEAMHALHANSGGDILSDMLQHSHDSHGAEEFIVSRLEAPLFAFMVENPAVLAFIVVGADEDRTE
jgi:hypothetical protein